MPTYRYESKNASGKVTAGVWPFLLAQTIVLFLLVLFPDLVLVPARWLH